MARFLKGAVSIHPAFSSFSQTNPFFRVCMPAGVRNVRGMNVEKIAVVGASGYSGEELIRLFLRHPAAELVAVTSRQWAGQTLDTVYPKFAGMRYAKLAFIESEISAIVHSG